MSFAFGEASAKRSLQAEIEGAQLASQSKQRNNANEQALFELDSAKRGVEQDNIELARKKAQKKIADFDAGYVDKRELESQKTDFERLKETGDYNLDNQKKAWESANTLRMREADQSNVAQKDRLVAGLDNQRNMQQSGFNQTNKLRSDDNQRAIDGFKMKF